MIIAAAGAGGLLLTTVMGALVATSLTVSILTATDVLGSGGSTVASAINTASNSFFRL